MGGTLKTILQNNEMVNDVKEKMGRDTEGKKPTWGWETVSGGVFKEGVRSVWERHLL